VGGGLGRVVPPLESRDEHGLGQLGHVLELDHPVPPTTPPTTCCLPRTTGWHRSSAPSRPPPAPVPTPSVRRWPRASSSPTAPWGPCSRALRRPLTTSRASRGATRSST